MNKKEEKSTVFKLDKKEQSLLMSIDKSSKWEDIKAVNSINDEIINLDIYKDFIGLGCSKYLNESAEAGEIDIEEMFRNCREAEKVRQRYKKQQKREELKNVKAGGRGGLSKGNIGQLTKKDDAKTAVSKTKPPDDKLANEIGDVFSKNLKDNKNDISKTIDDTINQIGAKKCVSDGFQFISSALYALSISYNPDMKDVGYENGEWTLKQNVYDKFSKAFASCGIYGGTILIGYLGLKGWKVVKDIFTSGPQPPPSGLEFNDINEGDEPPPPPGGVGGGPVQGGVSRTGPQAGQLTYRADNPYSTSLFSQFSQYLTGQQRAQAEHNANQNIATMFQRNQQNNPIPQPSQTTTDTPADTSTQAPPQPPRRDENLFTTPLTEENIPVPVSIQPPVMNTGYGDGLIPNILGGLSLFGMGIQTGMMNMGNVPAEIIPAQPVAGQPVEPVVGQPVNLPTSTIIEGQPIPPPPDVIETGTIPEMTGMEMDEIQEERQADQREIEQQRQQLEQQQKEMEEQKRKDEDTIRRLDDFMRNQELSGQAWGLGLGMPDVGKTATLAETANSLLTGLGVMERQRNAQSLRDNIIMSVERQAERKEQQNLLLDVEEQADIARQNVEQLQKEQQDIVMKAVSSKIQSKQRIKEEREKAKALQEQADILRERNIRMFDLDYTPDTPMRPIPTQGRPISNPLNRIIYQMGGQVMGGTYPTRSEIGNAISMLLQQYTILPEFQVGNVINQVLEPISSLQNAQQQRNLILSLINTLQQIDRDFQNDPSLPNSVFRTGEERRKFLEELRNLL